MSGFNEVNISIQIINNCNLKVIVDLRGHMLMWIDVNVENTCQRSEVTGAQSCDPRTAPNCAARLNQLELIHFR